MAVVVAIIGVLLAAAVPLVEIAAQRAQERSLREGLRTLRQALDAHRAAVEAKRIAPAVAGSVWPAELEPLAAGIPLLDDEGRPRNDGAKLFLLRRLPRDPFADPGLPAAQTWGLRASTSGPRPPLPGEDIFDVHSLSTRKALDGSSLAEW